MLKKLISPDGVEFRDLDHDGVMAPFEDPRLSAEERARDLVERLSLDEKVGLMFHQIAELTPDGKVLEGRGKVAPIPTGSAILEQNINHFNVHGDVDRVATPRWTNAVQEIAAQTPHSIPVTISTDPRHSFTENDGAAFQAGDFTEWAEPLGLGALAMGTEDINLLRTFGQQIAREYRAVGIHSALHPQADLASDPRWGRQFHTFGNDPDLVAKMTAAMIEGMQGEHLSKDSVSATVKHFPGGGPLKNGEDSHFPYGKNQVYPGNRFEEHLKPFEASIAVGTAAIMTAYGIPRDVEFRGHKLEAVACGFNKVLLEDILRGELGYDGVIVSDWNLIHENFIAPGVILPARCWGVEDFSPYERLVKAINAGNDQLGGESCTELLKEAVERGDISVERINASAYRLLLVKFQLGLFDNPFVDETVVAEVLDDAEARDFAASTQARATVVLKGREELPLEGISRVYVEGISQEEASRLGQVVDSPQEADVAVIRLAAPFEPRNDLFLEFAFQQGTLEYRPGQIYKVKDAGEKAGKLIVVPNLLRPALLGSLVEDADIVLGEFGAGSKAIVDVLLGVEESLGVLPFEIPSSMEAVRASREDVPNDTENPLYPVGYKA